MKLGSASTCLVCCLALVGPLSQTTWGAEPVDAKTEFFEKKIRPLLASRCYECHASDTREGGLRLDRRSAAMLGGDSGPAIVPGKVEEGFLLDAVNYGENYQMPPTGKLPLAEIALLTQWVRDGAFWPEDKNESVHAGEFSIERRRAEHWSWQPLSRPKLPTVSDPSWPLTDIDFFVAAKHQEHGLRPAAEADRSAWLRRVTFDLIGLPPTVAEIEAFLADTSDRAFETVVDRLLASPHFGERWARHWLDLVRYAESRGHEFDYNIPNVHHYRDYVIRALNADVPYNTFITEQIAGDLLDQPRVHPTEGFNESVLGTGFWHLGEEVHSPVDIRKDEADRIDNKVDVFSKTFLGLTVACARCHDHKFDAISAKDYYALSGFVLSSRYHQVRFDSMRQNQEVAEKLERWNIRANAELASRLDQLWRPQIDRLADVLLASREVVSSTATQSASGTPGPTIEEVATKYQLPPELLSHWTNHLVGSASKDTGDPVHFWAKCMVENRWDFADTQQSIAASPTREVGLPEGAEILIDYANLRPGEWITDGFAFGTAPKRPGDLRWEKASTPECLPFSLVRNGQAEYDPVWDGLALSEGTERDGGKLNGWVRAGRTLHTKTFTIPNSKLYYLVRGAADVYASIDSYHMVNGPLHGPVVTSWDAGDDLRWIEHDLQYYAGHRVHLEFTPKAVENKGTRFAIAMILASPTPPAPPQRHADMPLSETDKQSPRSLATAIQARLLSASTNFAGRKVEPSSASWLDWAIKHSNLLLSPADRTTIEKQWEELRAERAAITAQIQWKSRTAPAMLDGNGVDESILVRGNPNMTGELAPRQFLEALPELAVNAPVTSSGRLQLAQRLVDPQNPYVSRVLVNRVWHHLFDRGIVPSVDNFGVLGQAPSHPELLDYLATWFMDHQWSLKQTVRLLVLSRTYRMSSQPLAEQVSIDPENTFLHFAGVRRLQAEAIRDNILAVSGRLNRGLFGPSVPVYLTAFMEGRGRPESGPLDGNGRRSLYVSVRRNFLSPMMLAFDAPAPFSTVGRRTVSNVPAQALTMMNDPFVIEQANVWARNLLAEPLDVSIRIDRLFLTAFARRPSTEERLAANDFLVSQAAEYGIEFDKSPDDPRVWTDLCHTLFNSKEFVFLP